MAWVLDVNVVLALLHERHCHAQRASAWLDRLQEPGSCLLCRVAQMGALRLLTHPTVMNEDVISASDFWRGWGALTMDERMVFVGEPRNLELVWRERTSAMPRGESAGTDVYLAAFARAGGWRLATFDRGLARLAAPDADLLA
jgi:toxin-antitoxin system PIN domain toxin